MKAFFKPLSQDKQKGQSVAVREPLNLIRLGFLKPSSQSELKQPKTDKSYGGCQ